MVKFYELAIGSVFEFQGRQFEKRAMSMAIDLPPEGKGWGTVFMGMTEVTPIGKLEFLEPDVAEKWKVDWSDWTKGLSKAPETA